MSATKMGENTNNISKLLFFAINIHFVTSNQVSRYRKQHLPFSSSIYFVFLPLKMQKRLKQTKLFHAFSYFFWKETTHKPLKVAASLFSSVYVIGTTYFDEFIVVQRLCSPFCSFLWSQCFEGLSPHNQHDANTKVTNLIQSSYFLIFVTNLLF